MRDEPARGARSVAAVIYDGISMFEYGVACEVFGYDREDDLGVPWYQFAVCAATPTVESASGGVRLHVPHGLSRLRRADTIVVLPTDWYDRIPPRWTGPFGRLTVVGRGFCLFAPAPSCWLVLVCSQGGRATTHWTECEALANGYPDITVDPGVLYVDGGDILTSAGSAASIDLCLHVVRQDYGAEIANQVARRLVVPPHRHGGQAQFIDRPMPVLNESDLFAETMTWIQEHLAEPVSIDTLAQRAAMSSRSFARHFAAAWGTTPYQWLLRQRLHFAQQLLETTDLPIDLVAERSGFATAPNLRKHFSRVVQTSPLAYRQTFRAVTADLVEMATG